MKSKNAVKKIGCVLFLALLLLAVLVLTINDQALDELKFNLGLWTIIALVLIINLVSFVSFLVMYMIYRWVKKDLELNDIQNPDDEDLKDTTL